MVQRTTKNQTRKLWKKLNLPLELLEKDEVKKMTDNENSDFGELKKKILKALVFVDEKNTIEGVKILKEVIEQWDGKVIKEAVGEMGLNNHNKDLMEGVLRVQRESEPEPEMEEHNLKEYPVEDINDSLDSEARWEEETEETGGYDEGYVDDVEDSTENKVNKIRTRLRDFIAKTSKLAEKAEISEAGLQLKEDETEIMKDIEHFYKGFEGSDWAIPSKRKGYGWFAKLKEIGIIQKDTLPNTNQYNTEGSVLNLMKRAGFEKETLAEFEKEEEVVDDD